MKNEFQLEGIVGKVDRKEAAVFVRLVNKQSFHNKRSDEWETKENWFSIAFFGKTADSVERNVEVGDRMLAEGDIMIHPPEGPESRPRFNARKYDLLMPFAKRTSAKIEGPNDAE